MEKGCRRHFILSTALALLGGVIQEGAQAQAPGSPTGKPTVLVVGDSMSAEYGLARGSGWVALLEKRLATHQPAIRVVNASVSGDTTAGGRARLAALLRQHQPAVVILELGGNDALRGLPLQSSQDNLQWMTRSAQQAGARALLVGMQVPPNYGARYTEQFAAMFTTVAKDNQAALVPFLLKGIADTADPTALFQADRIHPSAQAQPRMLENVWPELRKLLPGK